MADDVVPEVKHGDEKRTDAAPPLESAELHGVAISSFGATLAPTCRIADHLSSPRWLGSIIAGLGATARNSCDNRSKCTPSVDLWRPIPTRRASETVCLRTGGASELFQVI